MFAEIFTEVNTNMTVNIVAIQYAQNTSKNQTLNLGEFLKTAPPIIDYTGVDLLSNNTNMTFATDIWPCSSIETLFRTSTGGTWVKYTHGGVFNIMLPASTNSIEYVEWITEDCLGNIRHQNMNITRDLQIPELSIEGIENGVVSNFRALTVNATDNANITSVELTLHNQTSGNVVCTNLCSISTNGTNMFSHGDVGYVILVVKTSSGESITLNRSFIFDDLMNPPAISFQGTENLSGSKLGPNTALNYTTDELVSSICVTILSTNYSTCSSYATNLQVDIQPGWKQNSTLLINSTDMHGNTASVSENFTYISMKPFLTETNTYYHRQVAYLLK